MYHEIRGEKVEGGRFRGSFEGVMGQEGIPRFIPRVLYRTRGMNLWMAGQRGGRACEGQDAGGGQEEYGTDYVVGIKDNSIQKSQFRIIY